MEEQFRGRIAAAYGRYAQSYASILEPILKPMAEEIVRLGKLRAGEWMLDLATGTGLIARTAAHPAVKVIGVDISAGGLARARSLSGGRIPLVVGDAHRLPFRDRCFHMVSCGLSLSHFSDLSVALKEILRVLRPGARFITSAWGSGGENPSKEAAGEVRRRFLEDRELTYGGQFTEALWGDTARGCEALRQNGFEHVAVTTKFLSGEYRGPSEAVETALAWPITRYRIGKLDPEDQRRLIEETTRAILKVDDLRWRSEVHYYQANAPGLSGESI